MSNVVSHEHESLAFRLKICVVFQLVFIPGRVEISYKFTYIIKDFLYDRLNYPS